MFVITVHNEVAKVMFLHLSVILFTGGVCLSTCWDTTSLGAGTPSGAGTPQDQAPPPPGSRHQHPRSRYPREKRRLLLRTVHILLECILVSLCCFRMFDDVIENHNVHKIEQNNDVYCVASGVPDVTNKHTMNSCDFLLEIMERVKTFRISSLPDVSIQIRAGAHTGTQIWQWSFP